MKTSPCLPIKVPKVEPTLKRHLVNFHWNNQSGGLRLSMETNHRGFCLSPHLVTIHWLPIKAGKSKFNKAIKTQLLWHKEPSDPWGRKALQCHSGQPYSLNLHGGWGSDRGSNLPWPLNESLALQPGRAEFIFHSCISGRVLPIGVCRLMDVDRWMDCWLTFDH